ncbi:MAG: betaine--homocysteine S-methyltransferase [Geminicoccaceae bacterium]|nr:betaine--homocysteine S-methyltransferase [Geminicoccaceae bacterium]
MTLHDLLLERDVLLADGAMGTSLFALGLETGDSPELWNVIHPERVREVHRGFIAAGADVVLTNSFGANRLRLKLHGLEQRVAELNRAAVEVARAAAHEAGRPVLVAGSIGPTGEILAPLGACPWEDARGAFAEQADALAAAGADLLWIETLSSAEELEAAVTGAGQAGLPVVATMTFDTQGRTMMGLTPADAVALRTRLSPAPVAFGANCGVHPRDLVQSVRALAAASAPGDILVAKGNCGIPRYEDGELHYDGTPAVMADYAVAARDAGARIIGGCCGTTADHLRAMAEALATRPRGASEPSPEPVTAGNAPTRRSNRRRGAAGPIGD